jgi:hypothetical protein
MLPATNCGLDFADKLREDTKRPDMSIDKIASVIQDRRQSDYSIKLTEEQARESKRFGDVSVCRVICLNQQLNDFANMVYFADTNESSNEIEQAGARWELDDGAIYQFWKDSGFPDRLPPLGEDEDEGVLQ